MVLKRLKQIFAKPKPGPHLHTAPDPTVDTVLHPGRPFCAIGDIHGRLWKFLTARPEVAWGSLHARLYGGRRR